MVVCEKYEGRTRLRRLNHEDLAQWLARYSLGELWMKGELGGTASPHARRLVDVLRARL